MSEQPVISCRGLGKTYRSGFFRIPFEALKALDLDVHRGEVFGFIGPNGAGKTTAIKVLMGLQSATVGQASLLGIDHRDPMSRARVGFLPERPYFYQHLTAWEFLDFYGSLFNLPKALRHKRIGELLERVRLERFADVPLRSFSKGMLQRAGVAQALINDPELVVMDEPMSGLDPMGRALIRDLIFEERAAGRTVFFSSHILGDVETLCDRVAILVKGELRGCGTTQELVGGRVRHVDVVYRSTDGAVQGLPGEELREQTQSADTTQHTQRVGPDQVDPTLDQLRTAGAEIQSVTPTREHLEDVLLSEVERTERVNKKRLGVLA